MAYYLGAGPGGEFEVLGSEGMARIRNNGGDWELWKRGPRAGWDRPALSPAPFPAFPRLSRSVNLLRDLRDAVLTGRDTLGNARVARAGTEMALGIVESHRRRRARGLPARRPQSVHVVEIGGPAGRRCLCRRCEEGPT